MEKKIFFKTVLLLLTTNLCTAACKNGFIAAQSFKHLAKSSQQKLNKQYKRTALMLAALNGDLPLVQKLINNKVNLRAQDKEGKEAIHYASIGCQNLLETQPGNTEALENYYTIIHMLQTN